MQQDDPTAAHRTARSWKSRRDVDRGPIELRCDRVSRVEPWEAAGRPALAVTRTRAFTCCRQQTSLRQRWGTLKAQVRLGETSHRRGGGMPVAKSSKGHGSGGLRHARRCRHLWRCVHLYASLTPPVGRRPGQTSKLSGCAGATCQGHTTAHPNILPDAGVWCVGCRCAT